jgi:hypothetical protein
MLRYSHAAWNSAAALLWDSQQKEWAIFNKATGKHEPIGNMPFDEALAVLRTYPKVAA